MVVQEKSKECRAAYNQKIVQFCRRFGKFRPRFIDIKEFVNLAESHRDDGERRRDLTASRFHFSPGGVMAPIADKEATWDVFVTWQRGKTASLLRALLNALSA